MHYFLHGEHHLSSRNFLVSLIEQAKQSGRDIIRLDGQKIELNQLMQAAQSHSLFGNDKIVVIENLFSRPKSKAQDDILNWLKACNSTTPFIFWEKKSIGKVLQRRLPSQTTAKEYKPPAIVFKLVEQLNPNTKKQALLTFQEAKIQEPVEFLFAMIVRQIRMLILVAENQKIAGAPWMVSKLKQQAAAFSKDQLIKLYQKLADMDYHNKTGKALMPLDWYLEVWISYL